MDNQHIVATLNRLIAQGTNGERAMRAYAEHAESGTLRLMLQHRADHCVQSVQELQEIVRDFGGEPRDTGTLPARLRQAAVLLRGLLLDHEDDALLNECERLQAQAMNRYRHALDAPLPPTVRKVVLRQFEGTQRQLAVARSMRHGTQRLMLRT